MRRSADAVAWLYLLTDDASAGSWGTAVTENPESCSGSAIVKSIEFKHSYIKVNETILAKGADSKIGCLSV